ncbi:MAG TPA: DUF4105 domain-containing protein [Variovorax sp.]|nr:DUF4105 domain-containing protein [Variovorax sp.]
MRWRTFGPTCGAAAPGANPLSAFVNGAFALEQIRLPLVLGAGIGSGRQIAAALALGADGVVMGSRFPVAREIRAHEALKKRIVEIGPEGSTAILGSIGDTWRVLRNDAAREVHRLESEGACSHAEFGDLILSSRTRQRVYPLSDRLISHGRTSSGEEESEMKLAVVVAISILILLVTAWWTLALVFAGPAPAWLSTALAASYALGTLAILLWLRPLAWAFAACGLAFVALLIWWSSIRPSNEGDWQADVARLPHVELRGEQLIVHDIRNFEYRSESDFTPRYEDRIYDLSALRGVDVVMSYWGSPAIAHTIMSWQFDNAPPLAVSIETRKRKGQEYSAVKGFFKQYEIIYVVADERDVVGLRTNHRGEQVYLYRLKSTPALSRAMLLDYVDSINGLVERPQFYNALVDNCTTSIRRHREHVDPDAPPFDWRLLANGYLDQRLYERSIVDTSLPFAELRSLSHIDGKAKAAQRDPAFSERIREGLPDPR